MGLSDTIRRLRNEAGYSQKELAELVGVCRSTVTHWENDHDTPRMRNMQALASLFGIPVSMLVNTIDDDLYPISPFITLTTLGKVHAGPFSDEDEAARIIEVPMSILINHPDARAVLVEGDCMNRVAPEGVAVVIDPNLAPANGKIVVVETEDHQALIRRWYRGENTLMLVADSFQSFDDIIVGSDTPIRVVGTVVWMQSASEIDL